MEYVVNAVCTLCGELFEIVAGEEELKRNYTRQFDGAYHFDRGDCWCDQCEENDMRCITRDYYPPNFRGHRI